MTVILGIVLGLILLVSVGSSQAFALEWKDSTGNIPREFRYGYSENDAYRYCKIMNFPGASEYGIWCKEFKDYWKKKQIDPSFAAEESKKKYASTSSPAVTGSLKIYINSDSIGSIGPLDRYGSSSFNVKCNDKNDVAISAGWEAPEGVFASVKKPVGTNSYDFKLIDMYKTSGKATLYVTCMQVD